MITVDLTRVTAVLLSSGWQEFPAGTLRVDKAVARMAVAAAAGAPAAPAAQQHLEGLFATFHAGDADYAIPLTAIQAFRQAP
jgi:hypothetical protein